MKKRILCVLLALLCTASCACGADKQGESAMEANNSSEDLSSFATGIKTEDEEKIEDTAFVLNDEIDERCPITYEATRGNVSYGEFTHGTYYSSTCAMERGYSI